MGLATLDILGPELVELEVKPIDRPAPEDLAALYAAETEQFAADRSSVRLSRVSYEEALSDDTGYAQALVSMYAKRWMKAAGVASLADHYAAEGAEFAADRSSVRSSRISYEEAAMDGLESAYQSVLVASCAKRWMKAAGVASLAEHYVHETAEFAADRTSVRSKRVSTEEQTTESIEASYHEALLSQLSQLPPAAHVARGLPCSQAASKSPLPVSVKSPLAVETTPTTPDVLVDPPTPAVSAAH